MKRVFPFLVLFLVPVLLAVPVLGAELSGGYYITGDSALGKSLTFYVPSDYAAGSLTYDENGYLFNLTSSSVYLYCPDYPDYTIYASRLSGFQYRTDSGYGSSYVDLNLTNVTDTNVDIMSSSPAPAISSSVLLVMILAVCIVGVGAFVLLRR